MSARRLVYLHGFGSSPQSSKAAYLAAQAEGAGIAVMTPDLNAPEFGTLTISRMVEQAERLLRSADAPVTLVGSSLGAVVALIAADRLHRGDAPVDTLVLMAPAVDLVPSLAAEFGPERLAEWERTNRLEVFHYAENRLSTLEWGFFADARRYDPWTITPAMPTLVFQGTRDETVAPSSVERWCSGRPHVRLRMLNDGHQLKDSLGTMWTEMREFMSRAPREAAAPGERSS